MATAGCSSIVETLCWCLCEAGDACLVPTPFYCAFKSDLGVRAAVRLVPVACAHPDYALSETVLDAAVRECAAASARPRMLLLTNPANPQVCLRRGVSAVPCMGQGVAGAPPATVVDPKRRCAACGRPGTTPVDQGPL